MNSKGMIVMKIIIIIRQAEVCALGRESPKETFLRGFKKLNFPRRDRGATGL